MQMSWQNIIRNDVLCVWLSPKWFAGVKSPRSHSNPMNMIPGKEQNSSYPKEKLLFCLAIIFNKIFVISKQDPSPALSKDKTKVDKMKDDVKG